MSHILLWLFLDDLFHQILFYFGTVLAMLIFVWERLREKNVSLKWIAAFSLFCLFVSCFQAWIDEHHNSETLIEEKSKLVSEKWSLQNKLDNKQLEVDWLRDHRYSGEDPKLNLALLTLTERSQKLAEKQYETKALSDKQLLDFTNNVITKIRDLDSKCDVQLDPLSEIYRSQSAQLQTMTPDQQHQFLTEQMRRAEQAEEQLRANCEVTYRQKILGDAAYARRELLARLGNEDFLLPRERVGIGAIDGAFAGSDPIGQSANYLDALAHKFQERIPKQP
jgi:hypothetical protein